MFIIANTISSRRIQVKRLFEKVKALDWRPECEATETLKEIALESVAAGADALEIDIQQHFDYPEAMAYAATFVQAVTGKQLCLSTNNYAALEAGLGVCKTPPIVNYVSVDEARISQMLTLAAKFNAEVILLVSDPSEPGNLDEMLERTGVFVGTANRMGISNEHIIIDPGIYHVTRASGQQHIVEVMEFLKDLPEIFSPPLRTTCWINNSSAGVPGRIRPVVDTTLLAMLAALGLSSVFIDVLRKENMRAVRLIDILQNKRTYAEAEIQLDPEKTGELKTYQLVRKG